MTNKWPIILPALFLVTFFPVSLRGEGWEEGLALCAELACDAFEIGHTCKKACDNYSASKQIQDVQNQIRAVVSNGCSNANAACQAPSIFNMNGCQQLASTATSLCGATTNATSLGCMTPEQALQFLELQLQSVKSVNFNQFCMQNLNLWNPTGTCSCTFSCQAGNPFYYDVTSCWPSTLADCGNNLKANGTTIENQCAMACTSAPQHGSCSSARSCTWSAALACQPYSSGGPQRIPLSTTTTKSSN